MNARWMFVILVGCGLTRAAQPQNNCSCDHMEAVCVPAGGSVTVPCLTFPDKDVTYQLLKNHYPIYNSSCSQKESAAHCSLPHGREGTELHVDKENTLVGFRLSGVRAHHYGTYSCVSIVTYPPPYQKFPSNLSIMVHVQGHQCKFNTACDEPEAGGDVSRLFPWLWIAVAVLIIYSITVTIISCVYWVKLRRTDSHSDYMNTKPRAPRDRKKRGAQNPVVPRHF